MSSTKVATNKPVHTFGRDFPIYESKRSPGQALADKYADRLKSASWLARPRLWVAFNLEVQTLTNGEAKKARATLNGLLENC